MDARTTADGRQRWTDRHPVALLVVPAVLVIGGAVAQAVLVGPISARGAVLVVLGGLVAVACWWAVVAWGVSVVRRFEATVADDGAPAASG